MIKSERSLVVLTCFFVVSLIVSNIIAAKVVCIGWIEIPAAVIAYPITFLCTDVISEIWGREEARRTVHLGFVVQIFSLILIYIAIYLPPAGYMLEFQSSFAETLGTSARFVLASLVAYGVAQTLDVHLFHWLRGRFEPKWMRNNGSTMVSQLFDTVIFITIGFWGVVPNLGWMMVSQYVVKWVFALADTPVFYYLTRHHGKQSE
ncbi:MAG TPA: queuosine precursor transporter [Methanocorpusculum sp.]|nr:queuosine precursor transporter [Methanocorpusculum sp.]